MNLMKNVSRGWMVACAVVACVATGSVASGAEAARQVVAGEAMRSTVTRMQKLAETTVARCRKNMNDGRAVYVPDASFKYRATWLRDFAYMLESGVVPKADILPAVRLFLDAVSPKGYGVDCIKLDGTPIYKPGYGSMGKNPVIDGAPFTVSVAYSAWKQTGERTFLEVPVLDKLGRCLNTIPRDPQTGLAWINPSNGWDRCAYGFTDTVRKTGCCFFESLLDIEATERLAEMNVAAGRAGIARDLCARAARVRQSVNACFWDGPRGLYRAATINCREHDIWGSAFAVWLGVADATQARRIAETFAREYDGIVARGQIRHLPAGVHWGDSSKPGAKASVRHEVYQNGGFWGTATGWFGYTLAKVDRAKTDRLFEDLVADLETNGVCEWHFGKKRACNTGYPASICLPLVAVRRLLADR